MKRERDYKSGEHSKIHRVDSSAASTHSNSCQTSRTASTGSTGHWRLARHWHGLLELFIVLSIYRTPWALRSLGAPETGRRRVDKLSRKHAQLLSRADQGFGLELGSLPPQVVRIEATCESRPMRVVVGLMRYDYESMYSLSRPYLLLSFTKYFCGS